MMEERTQEVRAVFSAAVAWDTPEERARCLDEACRGKEGLRERVEELLRAHDRDHPYLTKGSDPQPGSVQEGPGTVIGHYKILQQIGEGGFGVVFMAEQIEPVRRKVALKVVKPGMDSREVVARLEAERQALALMDHTNIAKVFEAGTTDAGRPYFVMELVRGLSVTDYCDEQDLPVVETWTGYRPTSRDDAPILGPSGLEGLIYALGHHRNGILLAPITARATARYILEGSLPASVRPFTRKSWAPAQTALVASSRSSWAVMMTTGT